MCDLIKIMILQTYTIFQWI